MNVRVISRKLGIAAMMLAISLCIGLRADAQSTRPNIEIQDAWIRPPTKLTPEPYAFFTIINNTDRDERLVSVVSRGGQGLLSHLHPGLRPYIERVQYINVPAFGSVRLKPGDHFVILRDPGEDLIPGFSVRLTLRFENAGTREIEAPISNQLLGNMGRAKPQ